MHRFIVGARLFREFRNIGTSHRPRESLRFSNSHLCTRRSRDSLKGIFFLESNQVDGALCTECCAGLTMGQQKVLKTIIELSLFIVASFFSCIEFWP